MDAALLAQADVELCTMKLDPAALVAARDAPQTALAPSMYSSSFTLPSAFPARLGAADRIAAWFVFEG